MKKFLLAIVLFSFISTNLIKADEMVTCSSKKDCKKGEECKSVCVAKEEKKAESVIAVEAEEEDSEIE